MSKLMRMSLGSFYYAPDEGAGSAADGTGGTDSQPGDQKPAAAPTGGSTDNTAGNEKNVDWEKKYKNLQPLYQNLKESEKSWDTERQQLKGQIDEMGQRVEEFEAQITTLNGQIEEGQQKSQGLEVEKTDLNKALERNQIIMSQFPDLVSYESKGLLPKDKEGDDLVQSLNDFRSLLSEAGAKNIQDQSAGFTPGHEHQSGGRNQADTAESLQDKIIQANQSGNFDEAIRLTNILVDMMDRELQTSSVDSYGVV